MRDKTKAWLSAIRLRTLPLAISTPALGSALAYHDGRFNRAVFFFATITSLLLQILSNLANDYGDFKKGVDGKNRVGPSRVMQKGLVSAREMNIAIVAVVIFTLISGLALISTGLKGENPSGFYWLFVLGVLAIITSLKYTLGKNPFGYSGFGDFFVFIWFGLVGITGTYFLHTHTLEPDILLPAASLGLLSAGVLNINNMRDEQGDKSSGKRTLVVIMGINKAKIYHGFLILVSTALIILFLWLNYSSLIQLLCLLTLPLFYFQLNDIRKIKIAKSFDPYLKKLVITILLFTITFCGGLILAYHA